MVKLGNLEIGKKIRIIGVIPGEKFISQAIRLQGFLLKTRKKIGVDIFELRIDRFDNLQPNFLITTIKNLKKKTKLPLLATIRRNEETNFRPPKHNLSEEKRFHLFQQIIPYVDGIDIELQAKEIISRVVNLAKKRGAHPKKKTVIVSYHNFKETPGNNKLNQIVKQAKKYHADIVKLTLYAKNFDDVARLMCFTYQCPYKPLVSISLGRIGNISRIIGSFFGSCLTYGFISASNKEEQTTLMDLIQEIKTLLGR